jgi:drug/metabolite transporter (DMT)-like permease
MRPRELMLLLLLAAIWGASFLLMRIAAPDFGPIPLVLARVLIAAVCLFPLLMLRENSGALRSHWCRLFLVGVLNSALPFILLAYATLTLTAGFTSLLNAVTPLMTALLGMMFWNQRLLRTQWIGLFVGMFGVAILCWGKLSFKPGGTGWAIAAALCAPVSYGLAGNYSKRHLSGISALASATGSMLAASIALIGPGIWKWPSRNPNVLPWFCALILGVLCTAVAYLIYFHLINTTGATQTASVTFLVPMFAMVWGALFLHEKLTPQMLLALFVILSGTALSTGFISYLLTLQDRLKEA